MAIQSITSGNITNTVPPIKSTTQNTVDPKNQPVNSVNSDDTVSITSTAQDIKNASGAGSTSATVNEARVAEIKAVLQAGDYNINTDRVADKMLQLDRILPNTT